MDNAKYVKINQALSDLMKSSDSTAEEINYLLHAKEYIDDAHKVYMRNAESSKA